MALSVRPLPVKSSTRQKRSGSRSAFLLTSCFSLFLSGCSGCAEVAKTAPQSPAPPAPAEKSPPPPQAKAAAQSTPSTSPPTSERPPAGQKAPGETRSSPPAKTAKAGSKKKAAGNTGGTSKFSDPESAYQAAGTLRAAARRAARQGDAGTAYAQTCRAWEAASAWPEDKRLKELADELADELEALGDQANAKFSEASADSGKVLIEK